jgi:hypothetical protein
MQGDGFASEPSGIMEVAMWFCIPLLLGLWVYYPTGPMDWFKEASGLDFENSSNIRLRLQIYFFFLDTYV